MDVEFDYMKFEFHWAGMDVYCVILTDNSESNRAADGATNIGNMWVATIDTRSRRCSVARA